MGLRGGKNGGLRDQAGQVAAVHDAVAVDIGGERESPRALRRSERVLDEADVLRIDPMVPVRIGASG